MLLFNAICGAFITRTSTVNISEYHDPWYSILDLDEGFLKAVVLTKAVLMHSFGNLQPTVTLARFRDCYLPRAKYDAKRSFPNPFDRFNTVLLQSGCHREYRIRERAHDNGHIKMPTVRLWISSVRKHHSPIPAKGS